MKKSEVKQWLLEYLPNHRQNLLEVVKDNIVWKLWCDYLVNGGSLGDRREFRDLFSSDREELWLFVLDAIVSKAKEAE